MKVFFKFRKNLIFERAKFNQRNQNKGEPMEQYITALYHFVETCEYRDFKNEMLRDWLTVGIRDATMSQKLQMDPDLMLEKAMKTVSQSAAVKEQPGQLKQLKEGTKGNPITLEEVRSGQPQTSGGGASGRADGHDNPLRCHRGGARGTQQKQGGAKFGQRKPQCKRCGKDHFPGDKCAAKGATCFKCNRKGHFSSQCLSKTVATTSEELSLDTAFLEVLELGKHLLLDSYTTTARHRDTV